MKRATRRGRGLAIATVTIIISGCWEGSDRSELQQDDSAEAPAFDDSVGETTSGVRKENLGNNGDGDYCLGAVLCVAGEGDCDSNAQCTGGSICVNDVGPGFNMPFGHDVCLPPSCANNSQDGMETGRDCGGACGTCVARTTPTNGGSLVIAQDNARALALNRTTPGRHTASFLALDLPTASAALISTVSFEAGLEEPVAGVFNTNGDDAYVVLRNSQRVVEFRNIRSATPLIGRSVTVGSEPSGIASSPTGEFLYVTNFGDGTVSVIRTTDFRVLRTVDLNARLYATRTVPATAVPRAAIAHPYAIVVTNDGDNVDSDESIYVTEFFSQARRTGVPAGDAAFDNNRVGFVYRIAATAGSADAAIQINPISDTTFPDGNGAVTGCFPNQLSAATINAGRLYVTAVCASPRGPVGGGAANFRSELHAALFVIDTATNVEVPAQRVLLTQRLRDAYVGAAFADNATRRMPLIPSDITFIPGTNTAYVSSYGSDALFKVVFNPDGSFNRVGVGTTFNVDLAPGTRLPTGVAVSSDGAFVLAVGENTRTIALAPTATDVVTSTFNAVPGAAPMGALAEINDGKRLFVTGLGRWSLSGQGVNSCEACHPNGLTDNVSWFFARGPRQTISLDGTYDSVDPSQKRLMNWTAIFDEVHDFELNIRGNSGGVGAIVHQLTSPPVNGDRIIFDGTAPSPPQLATTTPQAGLSGSTTSLMPGGATAPNSVLDDWELIDAYVKSIRSPRRPTNLIAADVAAGRQLFSDGNCAGCHGTSMWTISRVFYTPNQTNNHPTTGLLRSTTYTPDGAFPAALNPPTSTSTRTATLRFPAGPTAAANDQISCALRAVGTFPATLNAAQDGVSIIGVRVREARQDMVTAAQGATGFNPPSLLNAAAGAPFFHAGNARALEEVFSPTFAAHHQALAPGFLTGASRDTQIRQLVAFLNSIDESTAPFPVPSGLGFDPVLCPPTL